MSQGLNVWLCVCSLLTSCREADEQCPVQAAVSLQLLLCTLKLDLGAISELCPSYSEQGQPARRCLADSWGAMGGHPLYVSAT